MRKCETGPSRLDQVLCPFSCWVTRQAPAGAGGPGKLVLEVFPFSGCFLGVSCVKGTRFGGRAWGMWGLLVKSCHRRTLPFSLRAPCWMHTAQRGNRWPASAGPSRDAVAPAWKPVGSFGKEDPGETALSVAFCWHFGPWRWQSGGPTSLLRAGPRGELIPQPTSCSRR